ncbi:MAG: VWA domain-containing protein [Gemmatimonadetes bacterium]|nr:VWA domain-containing protein [Gemmatimonadota bacterium]
MTLMRPELLPLVPLVVALLAAAIALQWRRRSRLARSLSPVALGRLFPVDVRRFPLARLLCLAVAAGGLALGAAGVTPRPTEAPTAPAHLDLVIAVDVSASMGARDAAPSRVARARQVVARLAEALPGARIALVVFADWPYTLVPSTDDPRVIAYFADALQIDLVLDRDQGTSLSAVLSHARAALDERPRTGARRAVLLISDGGAHDGAASVLSEAAASARAGVEVWTAGLGTSRGAELLSEAGPVLDAGGMPVTVRLDEELLRSVAATASGRYERVDDDGGIRALAGGLQGSDAAPTPTRPPFADATLLLTLLALPLVLLEGALDSGRGWRGSRAVGETS